MKNLLFALALGLLLAGCATASSRYESNYLIVCNDKLFDMQARVNELEGYGFHAAGGPFINRWDEAEVKFYCQAMESNK